MYKFSRRSMEILFTCHADIRIVMMDVLLVRDIKVLSGLRTEVEQNELYRNGFSKKMYPNSKHNSEIPDELSQAVDIAPFPIDWSDEESFYYTAGVVMSMAQRHGVKLRWGGDWDMDSDLHDQSFMDLGHFELVR